MRFTLLSALLLSTLSLVADPNSGAIGIQYRFEEGEVIIIDVVKGSPAEKAGLKKDVVLVKVNNVVAESTTAVTDEITRFEPGSGKEQTVDVLVGKRSEVLKPKE
jgi:S1-C subfamily serine protease